MYRRTSIKTSCTKSSTVRRPKKKVLADVLSLTNSSLRSGARGLEQDETNSGPNPGRWVFLRFSCLSTQVTETLSRLALPLPLPPLGTMKYLSLVLADSSVVSVQSSKRRAPSCAEHGWGLKIPKRPRTNMRIIEGRDLRVLVNGC